MRSKRACTRATCATCATVGCWSMAPRPSADFRERLVTALDAGLSPGEAAAALSRRDLSTVYRWLARARRGESLVERPRSGRPPKLPPERYAEVRAVVLTYPDATLARACGAPGSDDRDSPQPVAPQPGGGQARPAAQKKSLIATERNAGARAVWRAAVATIDPRRLVFLDETSTPTTLTPLRARALPGQRAVRADSSRAPGGHLLASHADAWRHRREPPGAGRRRSTRVRSLCGAGAGAELAARADRGPGQSLGAQECPRQASSSKPPGVNSSSCRPIPRTSIPSSRPSPRSSRRCAGSARAPGRPSWPRLGQPSARSRPSTRTRSSPMPASSCRDRTSARCSRPW